MKKSIYRASIAESRWYKINPDESVIQVEWQGIGFDVSITFTRRNLIQFHVENLEKINKRQFDNSLRKAIEVIRAADKNNANLVESLLRIYNQ